MHKKLMNFISGPCNGQMRSFYNGNGVMYQLYEFQIDFIQINRLNQTSELAHTRYQYKMSNEQYVNDLVHSTNTYKHYMVHFSTEFI